MIFRWNGAECLFNRFLFSALLVQLTQIHLEGVQREMNHWNGVQLADNCGCFYVGEEVFFAFLDLWMDQFDSIASESTRKLSACALSSLLTLPLPGILKRLDSLLANMTTVCEEFGEGAVHDSKIDTLGSYSFDFHAGGGQGASMEGTIVQSESAAPECERKKTVSLDTRVTHAVVCAILVTDDENRDMLDSSNILYLLENDHSHIQEYGSTKCDVDSYLL